MQLFVRFIFLLFCVLNFEVEAFLGGGQSRSNSNSNIFLRQLNIQHQRIRFSGSSLSNSVLQSAQTSFPSILQLPASITKRLNTDIIRQWSLRLESLTRYLDISTLAALLSIGRFSSTSMIGGFLAGGLHAVTGPDHLAAILPSSVGLDGWHGLRIGAMWGLGHGFSAIFIGIAAFLLKGTVTSRFKFVDTLSSLAENAVGFSLIVIGFLGLKENIFDPETAVTTMDTDKPRNRRAIFLNGMLHGFSWDGAPSLAPAIAMTTWQSILTFLLSYCLGTVVAMSLASGVLSEGSKRIGNASGNPDVSKNLSIVSSIIAMLLGFFWVFKSKFN